MTPKAIALVADNPELVRLAKEMEAVELHLKEKLSFINKQAADVHKEANTQSEYLNNRLVEWLLDNDKISQDIKLANYTFRLDARVGVVLMMANPSGKPPGGPAITMKQFLEAQMLQPSPAQ